MRIRSGFENLVDAPMQKPSQMPAPFPPCPRGAFAPPPFSLRRVRAACREAIPLLMLFRMRHAKPGSGREDRNDAETLAARVREGGRVAIARAITLIESKKPEHRAEARLLLTLLNGAAGRAHRIGITGVPGAGKSTLIDALGCLLTARGHRVAVLAVDPSSSRSGGAILGDKTRMARLSADPAAFIRPSPSSGTLGGVARTTRETILLCEAGGFDIVLVETVGVGQSEVAVAGMVDFFLLLMIAGGGDELQGIKKGVMELADMIAITKADGGNETAARAAAADYRAALNILTPASASWKPPVIAISAREGRGLDDLWAKVTAHRAALEPTGEFEAKRREQDVRWMHAMIEDHIRARFLAGESAAARMTELERAVRTGEKPPSVAADEAAALILGRS